MEISKKKFIRFSLLEVYSKMVKGQFWKYRLTDFEVQISGHLVEIILCGEFGTPLIPVWFEKWKKGFFILVQQVEIHIMVYTIYLFYASGNKKL